MKERIVLVNGLSETELLRTLAKNGVNTIGLRVMSANELAKEMLIRCNALPTNKELPKSDKPFIIQSLLKGIAYFNSSSYADANNIANSLDILRKLIVSNENQKIQENFANSSNKNKAIYEVYTKYMEYLNANNLIDDIGIIRLAIDKADSLGIDIITLEEYPLTPLEECLAQKNQADASSLKDMFDIKEQANKVRYWETHGSSLEIETVFQDIIANKYSLDDCLVVATNPKVYSQYLFDLSRQYNIEATYGTGLSINNSSPCKLLRLYYYWDTKGYHSVDALVDLCFSDCFNIKKLKENIGIPNSSDTNLEDSLKTIGLMKIDYNKALNDQKLIDYKKVNGDCPVIEKIINELSKGVIYFIDTYSAVNNEFDESAKISICSNLKQYLEYNKDGDYKDIISQLYQININQSQSSSGKIHLTSLDKALSCLRNHLYIIGLSATNFPGSPKENYLLLDNELELFASKDKAPTSINEIEKKKISFNNLFNLAFSLNKDIVLSYSSYNPAELKHDNPSSILFETYQRTTNSLVNINDFQNSFQKIGYFDNHLSITSILGKSYNDNSDIVIDDKEAIAENYQFTDKKYFSPSAIEEFFNCPKRFYLTRILRIKESDPVDPFEIIDAREFGTLVHSMMEYLGNNYSITKDELLKKASEEFDNFLKTRIPLNSNEVQKNKSSFLELVGNGFEMDNKRTLLTAEENLFYQYGDLTLHGYPDRVEKDKQGNNYIIDYKTKRNFEHKENDVNTCLQVMIYAFIYSNTKDKITKSTYHYLRYPLNGKIDCEYSEATIAELKKKLDQLNIALDTGDFPCASQEEACKYCKLGDICGKNKEVKK